MIDEYVIKLIDNLPDNIKNTKKPLQIDLVLDGGIFNGSYLVGALYFLKEMERRNYIKIDRISGCSIGSIVAFLYYIDGLDLIDGINPFIFTKEPNKKILYLDLFGYDKIGNLINVKNEKSNFHRILSGLLDIHSFFIKQSNTPMCSYVNDWSFTNIGFNYFKFLIEKVCIYLTYLLILIKDKVNDDLKDTVFYKILSKITYDVFIIILENYCL